MQGDSKFTPIGFKSAFPICLGERETEKKRERSCSHSRVKMIGGTPPQQQHHSNRAAAFITNNKLCLQCAIFHSPGVVKEEQEFN